MSGIKIGKARYVALWALGEDFAEERRQILEPLITIYNNVHEEADAKGMELHSLIEKAEKDSDDQGGRWDPDEYSVVDALDSIVDDLAFKFQIHRTSIAQSILITAQTYLHRKFQAAYSAYRVYQTGVRVGDLREKLFKLGPSLGGCSWAEGVKAASNYVRHSEEWNVQTEKWDEVDGKLIITPRTDLLAQFAAGRKPNEVETIETLIKMGFSEGEIFNSHHNLSHRLVESLSLTENATFDSKAGAWMKEVVHILDKDLPSEVQTPEE